MIQICINQYKILISSIFLFKYNIFLHTKLNDFPLTCYVAVHKIIETCNSLNDLNKSHLCRQIKSCLKRLSCSQIQLVYSVTANEIWNIRNILFERQGVDVYVLSLDP